MIERGIVKYLNQCVEDYPIVVVNGARQSGKTTLLQTTFPEFRYLSLRDIRIYNYAQNEIDGFLQWSGNKCIIDDLEVAPKVLEQVYTLMYEVYPSGVQYIFTSTYRNHFNCDQIKNVNLLPLSWYELNESSYNMNSLNEFILRGGYPRLYDGSVANTTDFIIELSKFYISRNSYHIKGGDNSIKFINLIRALSFRIGNPLNLREISDACEISKITAMKWIDQLIETNLLYLLPAYSNSFSKRVYKAPKIYFCDTGMACTLQYITTPDQLQFNPKRNVFFTNMLINERMKFLANRGLVSNMYYYETTHNFEIPVLYEIDGELHAVVITVSPVAKSTDAHKILRFAQLANIKLENCAIIYNGKHTVTIEQIEFRPWRTHIVTRIKSHTL